MYQTDIIVGAMEGPLGESNQENNSSIHGQYYVKIFEKLDLPYGSHTIQNSR